MDDTQEVAVPVSIVGRVGHLENQVSGISQQLASSQAIQQGQGTRIDSIATTVEKVLDTLNAPPERVQWWPIIMGVVTLVGALNIFLNQALTNSREMTNLRFQSASQLTTYIARDVDRIRDQADLNTTQVAIFEARHEDLKYQTRHMDAAMHSLDSRITLGEAEISASAVSRRAIGDYAKETRQTLKEVIKE